VDLKGWQRTSLIDYPGHIATVLFTGGCNLRCPMCHNADLVLNPQALPTLPEDELLAFLAQREGLVDGVVITGGEPTLQADLSSFVVRLRESGLDVKLDTNGYRPEVLERLLQSGLVDYVAMDVKAPPEKLPLLTGRADADHGRIGRSIELLRCSRVSYEFRTTVVPGMLNGADIEAVARWIAGADRYVLQQFRPVNTLDPALETVSPYPTETLRRMAEAARKWVGEVIVR
jgi:pyruvate formate lyase activating enzyme